MSVYDSWITWSLKALNMYGVFHITFDMMRFKVISKVFLTHSTLVFSRYARAVPRILDSSP